MLHQEHYVLLPLPRLGWRTYHRNPRDHRSFNERRNGQLSPFQLHALQLYLVRPPFRPIPFLQRTLQKGRDDDLRHFLHHFHRLVESICKYRKSWGAV